MLQAAAPTYVQDARTLQAYSCAQTAQTRDSLPPGFNTLTAEDYTAIISLPTRVQDTQVTGGATTTPLFQSIDTQNVDRALWAQKQDEYHVRLAALGAREAKVAEKQARQALVASTSYSTEGGEAITETDQHARHAASALTRSNVGTIWRDVPCSKRTCSTYHIR